MNCSECGKNVLGTKSEETFHTICGECGIVRCADCATRGYAVSTKCTECEQTMQLFVPAPWGMRREGFATGFVLNNTKHLIIGSSAANATQKMEEMATREFKDGNTNPLLEMVGCSRFDLIATIKMIRRITGWDLRKARDFYRKHQS